MQVNKKIILLILLLFTLLGCSNLNVREDIYKECKFYYDMIDKRMQNGDYLKTSEAESIKNFLEKYNNDTNLTDNEKMLLKGIGNMAMYNLGYSIAKQEDKQYLVTELILEYQEEAEKVKQLLDNNTQ